MSGYGEFSEFECRKFAMKFAKHVPEELERAN